MSVNRRTLLASGLAVAAVTIARPHVARAAAPFEQPPLPYSEDALAPQISARTVGLHYGKHHKAYFTKLNELVPGTPFADMTLEEVVVESGKRDDVAIFNQAGQAWNHVFYWEQFTGGPTTPVGDFASAIERDFGGMDEMVAAIGMKSAEVFGTGWAWLVSDGTKLSVKGYQDAGNPLPEGLRPIVGIDLWEHAYYLDYENRKADHVKAVLTGRVNWAAAGDRMAT